ncbi:amidase [Streptomyces cellulosae]|uniref:amidase n=1 Tax=Streptomyces cellulosae TaxID=1968 RepID=UPI0004C4D42D|nr:amidase family protein [Streptomyces cellulosae]
MTDLWALPAHEMVNRLRSGQVTSVDLVEACLGRIAVVNPALNAVVVMDEKQSLRAARQVDDARARGEVVGPLAGLPYTAKLDFDVEGQATSEGSSVLQDAVATADGPMIARMRGAGAVLLGRTNEPDFGIVYHTNSALYGPTLNAWDATRTPGGSSGGEGVAISTGMSPLGLGSDIGGSIRGPAGFNGVTGLKPGLGRYPDHLETSPEPSVHEQLFIGRGPIARAVADLVMVDHVLTGIDARDPWTVEPVPRRHPYRRIGVVLSPTDTAVPDAITQLLRNAASALADLGYEVEETVLPNWEDLVQNFTDIMSHGYGGDRSGWSRLHPDIAFFLEHIHSRHEAPGFQLPGLGEALGRRHRLAVEFNLWHQKYDALIMPTWADAPFKADALLTKEGIEETTAASRHLYIFNLLGLPGLSLPIGTAQGLPVGAHVSSLRHREDVVLQVAGDLESRLGPLTPIDPR